MIKSRGRAAALLVSLNLIIVLVSVVYVLLFVGEGESAVISCVFKRTLHLYCPGCGGTRAVYYLLTLDPIRSFISNPTVIVSALFLLDLDIRAAISVIRGDLATLKGFRVKALLVIPIVIMVNFLVRNALLLWGGVDILGDIFKR